MIHVCHCSKLLHRSSKWCTPSTDGIYFASVYKITADISSFLKDKIDDVMTHCMDVFRINLFTLTWRQLYQQVLVTGRRCR